MRAPVSSRAGVTARAFGGRSGSFGVSGGKEEAAELASGLEDEVGSALEVALGEELRAVYDEARKRWPVLTGESRAGLQLTFDSRGTLLRGRIHGTAWYTGFIRQAGKAPTRPADRLVFEPSLAAGERILRRVGDKVGD